MSFDSASFIENPHTARAQNSGNMYFLLSVGSGTKLISVLPDLAVVDYGFGIKTLQNETNIVSATIYERIDFNHANGEVDVEYRRVSSLSEVKDTLAMASYPNNDDIAYFSGYATFNPVERKELDVLGNETVYTGLYYLEVNAVAPALIYNTETGTSQHTANSGRFLIVEGDPSGQRSSAWGGWIETVSAYTTDPGIPVDPQEPVDPGGPDTNLPPEVVAAVANAGDAAFEEQEKAHQEFNRKNAELWRLEEELANARSRLASLDAEQSANVIVRGIQTGAYASEVTLEAISVLFPARSLAMLMITSKNLTVAGGDTLRSVINFAKEPSMNNAWSIYKGVTDIASELFEVGTKIKFAYSAVNIMKATEEFQQEWVNSSHNIAITDRNIETIQRNIAELEARKNALLNHPAPANDFAQEGSWSEESYGLKIQTSYAPVLLMTNDNGSVSEQQDSVIIFAGQGQKATVSLSQTTIVEGSTVSRDTVVIEQHSSSVEIIHVGNGYSYITNGSDGGASLQGVDRVQFTNGTLAFDNGAGEVAGSAYRLYQAAFDRVPDTEGLSYWIREMDKGIRLNAVAESFINSPEFRNTYGTTETVSNTRYVELLYTHTLGRNFDQSGLNYWVERLDNNATNRSDLLAFFSESNENQARVSGAVADGIWYV